MWLRLAASAIVVISAAACSNQEDGRSGAGSTADCQLQIRSEGADFTQYGSTTQAGSRFGTAKTSSCEDVGENAAGSVFTEESTQVATFQLEGYSPSQVLGVKSPHVDGLQVFIADSVQDRDRERIYNRLNAGAGEAQ